MLQTDHQRSEDMSDEDDEELWQPPSSQIDLIPYWEYWHLVPHNDRVKRECHTPLNSPPQIIQRLAQHDGTPLFLTMPSSGLLKRTRPRFSVAGAVNPSPTLLNSAGSLILLALENQLSMNIQKSFYHSVCVLLGLCRDLEKSEEWHSFCW